MEVFNTHFIRHYNQQLLPIFYLDCRSSLHKRICHNRLGLGRKLKGSFITYILSNLQTLVGSYDIVPYSLLIKVSI